MSPDSPECFLNFIITCINWKKPGHLCSFDIISENFSEFDYMLMIGNLWRELWETSKPVPAVKQAPLFDEDLAVLV